jgi:hypothetical protein
MEAILDFSRPLDVALLDNIVKTLHSPAAPEVRPLASSRGVTRRVGGLRSSVRRSPARIASYFILFYRGCFFVLARLLFGSEMRIVPVRLVTRGSDALAERPLYRRSRAPLAPNREFRGPIYRVARLGVR